MKLPDQFRSLTPSQRYAVIAGVVVLIIILIVALNPRTRTQSAQNTKRSSDILAILNAVHAYVEDDANSNNFPPGIPSVAKCSTPDAGGNPPAGAIDVGKTGAHLERLLVKQYIEAIPHDPDQGTADTTGYKICSDSATNAITVWAIHTEPDRSEDLKVTR